MIRLDNLTLSHGRRAAVHHVSGAFAPGSRRLAWALPFVMYGVYILSWFLLSRHGSSCYIPYQSWPI